MSENTEKFPYQPKHGTNQGQPGPQEGNVNQGWGPGQQPSPHGQHGGQQPGQYPGHTFPGQAGPGTPNEPVVGGSTGDVTGLIYGATFAQALKGFFKNYVNFKGEASRSQYWWPALFFWVISVLLQLVVSSTGEIVQVDGVITVEPQGIGKLFEFLGWALSAATLLPTLAVGARRLRNAGLSPWLLLLWLVLVIGWIALFVLFLLPGKTPQNQYNTRNFHPHGQGLNY